jgi:hypothetical protein
MLPRLPAGYIPGSGGFVVGGPVRPGSEPERIDSRSWCRTPGRPPVELFPEFVADEVDHAAHPEPAGGVVDEEELHTAHTANVSSRTTANSRCGTFSQAEVTADRVITGCIAPLISGRSPAAIRVMGPIGISSDLADSASAWASRRLHLVPYSSLSWSF